LQRWLDVLERLHSGVPRSALVASMNAAQTGLMPVALLSHIEDLVVVRESVRAHMLAGLGPLAGLPVPS
jgi:hypothetical protein